ncbi:MAG: pilus assembly protein PilM [Magnetococcus sp. MYC-9]
MFSLSRLFRRPHRPRPVMAHHPVIGLDIGSSAIKVAEIQRSGKQWQLLHSGLQPLAPEVVVDGQIKQPDQVVQAIKELLSANGITTRQAAISLGGSSVITKKIQMAALTELELEDQIALEAEEYIPFDIEEVYLDFQILHQQEGSMEVLLTACKKEVVHSHAEVVRQAGLLPKICDLDLFCLLNAYSIFLQPARAVAPPTATPQPASPPGGGSVLLANLGGHFLNIAIVSPQGLPGYIRDHSLGGRQLVQEISSRHELSWAEAEQRLIMPDAGEQRHSEQRLLLTETIHPFLEQLVQQIRQAVSFHKTGNPEQPVAEVYLSGGCALLPDADSLLGEQLGLPVTIAAPFANLTHRRARGKQESAQKALLTKMAPRFMVALGLALRGDYR